MPTPLASQGYHPVIHHVIDIKPLNIPAVLPSCKIGVNFSTHNGVNIYNIFF